MKRNVRKELFRSSKPILGNISEIKCTGKGVPSWSIVVARRWSFGAIYCGFKKTLSDVFLFSRIEQVWIIWFYYLGICSNRISLSWAQKTLIWAFILAFSNLWNGFPLRERENTRVVHNFAVSIIFILRSTLSFILESRKSHLLYSIRENLFLVGWKEG